MGYYNGQGVTTGGGEKITTLRTFAILGGGSFKVSQKNVYHTLKKQGVSLATAQASHVSQSLSNVNGGYGTYAWIVFDAQGTRSTPAYSQIADSNLYELDITNETLTAFTESA